MNFLWSIYVASATQTEPKNKKIPKPSTMTTASLLIIVN